VLENLQIERLKNAEQEEGPTVTTHYYNPDDEREIKGATDKEEAARIYEKGEPDSPSKVDNNDQPEE
jgi:hypothetical protein